MRSTILGNSETMKVYVERLGTPEICRIVVINLRLIKACKDGCSLTHRVQNGGRIAVCLKLRRGQWEVDLPRKHKARYEKP